MSIEARLNELGITLPEARTPSQSYVNARQTGTLLFLAGHSPKKDGVYPALGKVGANVTLEQAQECARSCVINLLVSAKHYLGSLDRVRGIVHVNGYVASTPEFTDQPKVMNAASDLLVAIFGERGRHSRTSVGVPVLPGDIPVEIEMILEIEAAE